LILSATIPIPKSFHCKIETFMEIYIFLTMIHKVTGT